MIIRLIASAVLGVTLMFPCFTHAAPQAEAGAPRAEASRSLYWQGHEALGRSDWSGALQHFRALERELARSGDEPADAAIYWQAYALAQAKRTREAAAEVDRLQQAWPNSQWLDEAEALARRTSRRDERGTDGAESVDGDALMALDALLAGGSEKAVPVLQRVIAGNKSDRVKARALFVLGQIDSVAADRALDAMLAGDASSTLKAEAVRMIAAGGRAESLDRLVPLLQRNPDPALRRALLDAFVISDRGDLMRALIEQETDPAQRRSAIERLGAMEDTKQLTEIYASHSEVADRRAALRGLGVAGAQEALLGIARSERDPELRAEAIRSIGIAVGEGAGAAVAAIWRENADAKVRHSVLDALTILDDTATLVELYRAETDAGLRRQLLQRISSTDPDGAIDLIDAALKD